MRASGGEARPGSWPVGALVVTVEGELCCYTGQEGTEAERREMGCGACKTSHFGKNTLKNRRFLESNNADSGEGVRGLPKALVKMPKRCRVRTGRLPLRSAGLFRP